MQLFLDLETTDTKAGAGVWEIGALAIVNGQEHTFFRPCRPTGTVTQSTIDWINSKPDVAERYNIALSCTNSDIDEAVNFAEWLHGLREGAAPDRHKETVYSWGTFDFPIMGDLFERNDWPKPWHYGSECDLRSVAKYFASKVRPDTSTHAALADAAALMEMTSKLNYDIAKTVTDKIALSA